MQSVVTFAHCPLGAVTQPLVLCLPLKRQSGINEQLGPAKMDTRPVADRLHGFQRWNSFGSEKGCEAFKWYTGPNRVPDELLQVAVSPPRSIPRSPGAEQRSYGAARSPSDCGP